MLVVSSSTILDSLSECIEWVDGADKCLWQIPSFIATTDSGFEWYFVAFVISCRYAGGDNGIYTGGDNGIEGRVDELWVMSGLVVALARGTGLLEGIGGVGRAFLICNEGERGFSDVVLSTLGLSGGDVGGGGEEDALGGNGGSGLSELGDCFPTSILRLIDVSISGLTSYLRLFRSCDECLIA